MLTFRSKWDGVCKEKKRGVGSTKTPTFSLFAVDEAGLYHLLCCVKSHPADKGFSWHEPPLLKIIHEKLEQINAGLLDGDMSAAVALAIAQKLVKHRSPQAVSSRLIKEAIAQAVAEALKQ